MCFNFYLTSILGGNLSGGSFTVFDEDISKALDHKWAKGVCTECLVRGCQCVVLTCIEPLFRSLKNKTNRPCMMLWDSFAGSARNNLVSQPCACKWISSIFQMSYWTCWRNWWLATNPPNQDFSDCLGLTRQFWIPPNWPQLFCVFYVPKISWS